MYKACSRCGRIHSTSYKCPEKRIYTPTEESNIRNSHSWHKKSEEIKRKSNYLCELCRELEHRYTYDNLEVHHIDKLKDKPERLLDNYNLICLCEKHHTEIENNIKMKDLLFELARRREDG